MELSKCSKSFLGFQALRYKVENNKQTFRGWSFNNSKAKTRVTSSCSTSSINAPEDHEREGSHRCWLSAMNQPSLGDAGFYTDPCYFYSCCHRSNCHYNCCFCPYSLSSSPLRILKYSAPPRGSPITQKNIMDSFSLETQTASVLEALLFLLAVKG